MTFPTVVGVSETLVTANATSIVAAIPNGSNTAGRLVILAVACDGTTAMTWPGSPAWTVLDAGNDGSTASRLEVRYRFVDGSEGWASTGQTITVSGGNEQWCAYGVLISGQHASQAPEGTAATGTTGNFDPASETASWGAEDNLWLVFAGADAGPAVTGWPANYTDNQQEGDTGGAAAGVTGAMATRNLNAASDNPGAFTNDTTSWRTLTVVVRTAGATTVAVPTATASGAAGASTERLTQPVPTATATGSAPTPTERVLQKPPAATATGAANASTERVLVKPGAATATGAANAPTVVGPLTPADFALPRTSLGPSGPFVLILDPHSEANPTPIPVNGGSFTWVISDTGSANVECWTADLLDNGLLPPSRLAGMDLSWEHDDLGVWAGRITAPRSQGAAGVTEVVAKAWDSCLAGRRTPKISDTGMASAGAVFRRSVEDRYRASDPIGVGVTIRSSRALVPAAQRANDLLVLARALVQRTGEEYWVDHENKTVEWTRRAGRDKSAEVAVAWGREVVDFDYQFDLEAIFNELLIAPALSPYDRTRTVTVRDEASISRHGLRQSIEVAPGLITRAALRSIGYATLSRLANQGDSLALTIDGTGGTWAEIREGDSITAILPPLNLRARVRVKVRHYDLESGLETLSCDVESEL